MTTRRHFLTIAGAVPFVALTPRLAFSASAEVFNTGGIAIQGYDPVGYFKESMPVDGSDSHVLKWRGVMWRFSTAQNMADFEANPDHFAPRYGGYCAYAMSKGAIANTVPEAWTIYEDRLYLNFSTGVRGIWRKDIPANIAAANGFWPGILTS